MDINKKVCDSCKGEKKEDEMYLSIMGEFTFTVKYAYGFKHFNRSDLDFCNLECFSNYITKKLMENY